MAVDSSKRAAVLFKGPALDRPLILPVEAGEHLPPSKQMAETRREACLTAEANTGSKASEEKLSKGSDMFWSNIIVPLLLALGFLLLGEISRITLRV